MKGVYCSMTVTLAALSLLTGPALGAEPQSTLDKIKTTRTITIGHRDASRPFSFLDTDGKPAGYSVDLCVRIANALQQELKLSELALKWVKVTPENRLTMVANGTVDIECGSTTNTLSRQEQVDFTSMTFSDGGGLLTLSANELRSVNDLAGKRVGIAPGTTTEKALAQFLKEESVTVQT